MKTAIQELIEYIEKRYAGQVSEGIVLKSKDLLEKEKQQIIDACIKTTQDCWVSNAEAFGLNLVFSNEDLANQKEEAEQYYNETFKND